MTMPSYIQGNLKDHRGMSMKYNGTFISRTYYSTEYGQKLAFKILTSFNNLAIREALLK